VADIATTQLTIPDHLPGEMLSYQS